MTTKQRQLIDSLVAEGYRRLNSPRQTLRFFTNIPECEALINDIEDHPHFYVLGCVMDRQIKAEKAWVIPYKIDQIIGGFQFADFLQLDQDYLIKLFNEKKFHRFNTTMAKCFFAAVQDIHTKYADNAANIWADKPKAIDVVNRFKEFQGIGDKIANMAVNILVRDFKVPMSDYSSIDIPPDSQVKKFFVVNGFIDASATPTQIINLARELYPEYPGLLDIAWEEGRKLS